MSGNKYNTNGSSLNELCNFALMFANPDTMLNMFDQSVHCVARRTGLDFSSARVVMLSYLSNRESDRLMYETVLGIRRIPVIFDPCGFERDICFESSCINDCFLVPRETHPFATFVPLVGGMHKKKNSGKKSFKNKKNKAIVPLRRAEGVRVPRQFGPVPKMETVYMKFYEVYSSGAIATTVGFSASWKANSVFAPQQGGGSSIKPYGYDFLSTAYNRYRVISVRTLFTVCQNSAALPLFVAAGPLNGTIPVAVTNAQTFYNFAMIPRVKSAVVDSVHPVVIKLSYLNWQLTNAPPEKYLADDLYQAAYNASPTEVMNEYFCGYNGSSGNATFELSKCTEYKVIWSDEFAQAGSTFTQDLALLRQHPNLVQMLKTLAAAEQSGISLDFHRKSTSIVIDTGDSA